MIVVGEDNERLFKRLARQLGVMQWLWFMQGQADVTCFVLGADLLAHPIYSKNSGTISLDARNVSSAPLTGFDMGVKKTYTACQKWWPITENVMRAGCDT